MTRKQKVAAAKQLRGRGLTHREIARRLDISSDSAVTMISRARKQGFDMPLRSEVA